jgi:hypothetical protein
MFNQKGSVLFIVLGITALIGAAAAYLMSLAGDTEKKIVSDARVVSYQNLVETVKAELYAQGRCTALLGNPSNRIITNAFNEKGMSIELDLQLKANPRKLKKPSPNNSDLWFLQGGTSVRDVYLVVNERVATPIIFDLPVSPNPPQLIAAKGYILIEPGHHGVGYKNWRNKKKYRIPLLLYYKPEVTGTKTLKHCFDPTGEAYACTIMGGAYDETQTTSPRCRPMKTCFYTKGQTSAPNGSAPACVFPETVLYYGSNGGNYTYSCSWCNSNWTSGISPREGGKFFNESISLNPAFEPDFGPSVQVVSSICTNNCPN